MGALKEAYNYDPDGNLLTQLLHLPQMTWDFKDQLASTHRQVVNNAPGETTYYVYDASGQRVHKVTQSGGGAKTKERIYIGGYEVYREYGGGGGTVTLERQTVHVMDDKRRVAMVETNTTSGAAPVLRFQFGNHLGSALLELDASAAIISYEEYFPHGGTSFQSVSGNIEVSLKTLPLLKQGAEMRKPDSTITERGITRRGWGGGRRAIPVDSSMDQTSTGLYGITLFIWRIHQGWRQLR